MAMACVHTLIVYLVLCAPASIKIHFADRSGRVTDTREYDRDSRILRESDYVRLRIGKYAGGALVEEAEHERPEMKLVCRPEEFEAASSLADAPLAGVVDSRIFLGILDLAESLMLADESARAAIYRNLARTAADSREGLMAEIMRSRGQAHTSMFAMELLREHIGAYGIEVHARNGEATLCATDVDECPQAPTDGVVEASRVRVLEDAMETAVRQNAHRSLGWHLSAMSIEALDVSECEMEEDTARMIGAMDGLASLNASRSSMLPVHLAHLLGLKRLRELRVSGNRYLGEEGLATIGTMKSLTVLGISRCELQEGALRHIAELRDLTKLYVSHNKLNRDDLAVIGAMKSLTVLDIGNCEIKGGLEHIQGLENLCELYVSHNKLDKDDIAVIGAMKSLTVLDIGNCEITGGLEHIQGLENLCELYVSHSKLDKDDIAVIGAMKSLEVVDTNRCCIYGSLRVPESVSAPEKIRELYISSSYMGVKTMEAIGKMTSLTKLDISKECNLPKGRLSHIQGLKSLQELYVSRSRLEEEDMQVVGKMENLTKLDISECDIPVDGIGYLEGLVNLKELSASDLGWGMSRHSLSDKELKAIGGMKRLEKLDISGCSTSYGVGLGHLGELDRLIELNVSGDEGYLNEDDFEGIGKMKSLRKLDISECRISRGSLRHIQRLTNLRELDATLCDRLSGEDLDAISEIKSLRKLNVSGSKVRREKDGPGGSFVISRNKLEREDLLRIGKMTGLTHLLMGNCHDKLQGLLKGIVKDMANLRELSIPACDLDRNDIVAISKLKKLRKLDIGSSCKKLGKGDLSKMESMKSLRELRISRGRGEKTSFVHLRKLKGLRRLSVSSSELREEDMSGIKDIEGLVFLSVDCCKIEPGCLKHFLQLGSLRELKGTHELNTLGQEGKDVVQELRGRGVLVS